MSWDVFLFHAPPGLKSIFELPKEYDPPKFDRARVVSAICALFPEAAVFSEKDWGYVSGDGWSMEVNLDPEPTCSSLMLHIRGGGDPVTAALAIADALALTAIDCSSGEILTVENNCFNQWRAYRDQVVAQSRTLSVPGRLGDWFRKWFG